MTRYPRLAPSGLMRTAGCSAVLSLSWLTRCCASISCFLPSGPGLCSNFERRTVSSSHSPCLPWCGASSSWNGADDRGDDSIDLLQDEGGPTITFSSGEPIAVRSSSSTPAEWKELNKLLRHAGLVDAPESKSNDATVVQIIKFTSEGAFCNQVYRIRVQPVGRDCESRKNNPSPATVHVESSSCRKTRNPSTCFVAKVFSNLSLTRRDPLNLPPIGVLDRLVSQHGLAPRVMASTNCSILTELCRGRPLTEADVHARENPQLAQQVGNALSQLHHIHNDVTPLSGVASSKFFGRSPSTSCLWYACDQMLELSDPHFHYQGWTIPRFRKELERQRTLVDVRYSLPLVEVGHGDCKPANVFVGSNGNNEHDESANYGIQFIDLELAGPHYRAFDLAKFFRTDHSTRYTHLNQRTMLRSYLDTSAAVASGCSAKRPNMDRTSPFHYHSNALQELEREVTLACPLTWLEAAIFFVCRARDSTSTDTASATMRNHWMELMEHRLEGYVSSIRYQ